MRKFAIIVYCLYGDFLVSGIQLNQVLPTQPCSCNTYQESLSIPAFLQPTNIPQQLIQEPLDIYKQPNNNNLYPQQILIRNDLASPHKQRINIPNNLYQYPLNQQSNPITDQLSQLYMNKILSNPIFQGILDSNIRQYNTPFLELPNQSQGNVFLPQGNVPHVVNNYFILPPELLNMNEEINAPRYSHGHRNDKNINIPLRDNGNKRKQVNKQATDVTDPRHHKRRISNGNDCLNNHQNKRGKLRSQNDHQNVRRRSEEEKEKRGTRRKQNRNLSGEQNSDEKQQNVERDRDGQSKNKRTKNNDKEFLAMNEERLNTSRTKEKISSINEPVEVTESKKRKDSKKNSRDSRDEGFIKDFRKKFPGIPEEVVKSLLSYLRRQLKNQQLGQSPVYHPDVTFPLQFEQLFPYLKKSHIAVNDHNNHRKRRPNRRFSNQRQNQTHKPKITLEDTTAASTVTDAAITKSKSTTSNSAQTTTDNFVETTTFESTTINNENNVDVTNFLTDDYYPNFANDNNYFNSEEIQIIRNHRDNRYHYTTDKNNEFEITRDISIENVLIKPNNNDHSKDISTFRTPPLLESPDFRTTQIKKATPISSHYKDTIFEKSSTYSDIKTTPTKNLKERPDKCKKMTTDIETVFAHSKVIKYGKNNDVDEENETPIVTYYIPDNMQYEEDGKTVIVAKSIPADYFW